MDSGEIIVPIVFFALVFGIVYIALNARNKERMALIEKGAKIKAHDPQGMDEARHLLPAAINYTEDAYDACRDADAVILLTEWNQYRALDLDQLKSIMRGDVFIDLRNVYLPEQVIRKGFTYTGVGRR